MTRTHQAECEKPTLADWPAWRPRIPVRRQRADRGDVELAVAVFQQLDRAAQLFDVHGRAGLERDDLGESPRTGKAGRLTNTQQTGQHVRGILATFRAQFTISILLGVVCL